MEDLITRMNLAEKRGDKLKEEFDKKWFKRDDIMYKFDEYQEKVDEFFKEYYKLKAEYDFTRTPVMSSLSDYGDLITTEEFRDCCMSGGFIDYDGHGYYATKTEESDIIVKPSTFKKGKERKDFDYVIWFNR